MIVDLEGTVLYVTKNITEQAGPHSVSLHGIKSTFLKASLNIKMEMYI